MGLPLLAVFLATLASAANPYTLSLPEEYRPVRILHDTQGFAYITGSKLIPFTSTSFTAGPLFLARIDPQGDLLWVRNYDGESLTASSLAFHPNGDLLLTGSATRLPSVSGNAIQSISATRGPAAFLARIDPATGEWRYSTYFGGLEGSSNIAAITTDADGFLYLTGHTFSPDYPVTGSLRFGPPLRATSPGMRSGAFIAKLTPSADQIVFSALISGSFPVCASPSSCTLQVASTIGSAIAIDGSGNIVIAGNTGTADLPTTENAIRRRGHGAFVAAIQPGGAGLAYLTYLSSALTQIPPVVLSGSLAKGMATHPSGDVVIAGMTFDKDFPVTAGAYQTTIFSASRPTQYDAFLIRLKRDGSGVVWGTVLGGSGDDQVSSMAMDGLGRVWLTGTTGSTGFPRTESWSPTGRDFVALFSADGSQLHYSARFPSSTTAMSICAASNGIARTISSSGFLTSHAPWEPHTSAVFAAGPLDSAVSSPLAPGKLMVIRGAWIGPADPASAHPDSLRIPTTLAGRRVLFDGISAPILHASQHELLVSVPFAVAGSTKATLTVEINGHPINPLSVRVWPASLELLHRDDGTAFLHPDGSPVSSRNPAHSGDTVIAWVTGAGVVEEADGIIATEAKSYHCCTVLLNYSPAVITYSGTAPGLIAGITQIAFVVPQRSPDVPGLPLRIRSGDNEIIGYLLVDR